MELFPLAVFLGPIALIQNGEVYLAHWTDPEAGSFHHPIDPKWNPWLEEHFPLNQAPQHRFVFVPPEMLSDHPVWQKRVKEHCGNSATRRESQQNDPDDGCSLNAVTKCWFD